jgi:hypothetical protein
VDIRFSHKLTHILCCQVNRDGDKLLNEIKWYSPAHMMESFDHGLRAVFLVPTTLGRLFVRTEREAPVELDGGLQTRLSTVTVMTDGGAIRLRDLQVSRELRLSTRTGDIVCEGVIDGHLVSLHAG